MQTTTTDGKTFTLTVETEADHQLIDALALQNHVHCASMVPGPKDETGGWQYQGAVLLVNRNSKEALRAQTSSQALSALREVFRLGLGEQTDDLVARLTRLEGNLQPQEEFSSTLKHLQTMLETLVFEVGQQKAVINELMRTHSDSPVVETVIVEE